MELVYHIGMHCTDADRVLRALSANAARLAADGVLAPGPKEFRPVLKDAMVAQRGRRTDPAQEQAMREAIAPGAVPARIIFSNDNFLCPALRAVDGRTLYPLVTERIPWIANLFPSHRATLALAMRNPLTLLPALHARLGNEESLGAYVERVELAALSWEDVIARIRAAAPDADLLVWCHEDQALIWPEVLAALTGLRDVLRMDGIHEAATSLMTAGGMARMEAYMEQHPPKNMEHLRRVTAAFLDKFARPEAMEVELDVPGWSEELATQVTARYEADIAAIGAMDGVTLLAP